ERALDPPDEREVEGEPEVTELDDALGAELFGGMADRALGPRSVHVGVAEEHRVASVELEHVSASSGRSGRWVDSPRSGRRSATGAEVRRRSSRLSPHGASPSRPPASGLLRPVSTGRTARPGSP